MSATDIPNGSATKRTHDEITDATSGTVDAPAQKRQNVGETPSVETQNTIPVSKADQVVAASTNVMTEPTPARPSLTGGDSRKQQKEKHKQRAKEKYEKGAERYKGKGVREWGSRNDEAGQPAAVDGADKTPRLPKYKCAILLGFSGSGYNGMQMYVHPTNTPMQTLTSLFSRDSQNPSATSPDAPPTSTKTIEGILFQALVKAGAVAATNADDPKKVDLSRAARTDAGVSAAGNVVSLKMIIKPPGIETPEELTKAINEHLPEDIRVWSWTRTLQGFNARTACDTRVYEYLLPSYTLLPPRPGTHLHQQTVANATKAGVAFEEHEFWKGYDHDAALEAAKGAPATEPLGDAEKDVAADAEMTPARRRTMAELAKKRGFRISKEEVERFRQLMKAYLGTHNFHNYTLNKSYNDRSCNRYMIDINVDEPVEHNGMEWISVKIHGQSFMLHQIRKMISLAVLAARTRTPASLIPKTFGPEQIHVPKAPALGLLLEQPRFKTYNDNAAIKSKQNKVEHNHPLEFETHKDEIFAFKLKHIYERLRRDEESAAHYHNWNTNLDNVQGPSLSYLNPQGEIPEEAMRRKKGTGPKGDKEKTLDGVESDDDDKPVKDEE
ncbi:hypothetical protein QFC20_003201 [Naganishia adeliensis]|uniref:Uncharacterized protein n=1 Tax=Naganishia adeliensis TaxID=92952 RepID=A0ACC2WF65_9TREE|nr:hypothetical protein QFC20_003201 [Naganishia adeliensis]